MLGYVWNKRRLIILASDVLALILCYWVSFLIRFDGVVPPLFLSALYTTLPAVVVIKLIPFHLHGLYREMWRYAGIRDLLNVIGAVTMASVAATCLVLFIYHAHFPRSVLLIDYFLCIVFIGGIRFTARIAKTAFHQVAGTSKRVLIFGAGNAGERLCRELIRKDQRAYRAIGFIDDDLKKKGLRIHGVPILGSRNDICRLVEQKKIDEIILAVPSAGGTVIKEIMEVCNSCGQEHLKVKTIPSMIELLDGSISINQVREVKVEDLLNREVIELDLDSITKFLDGKRVLITGAGGTIGSELCRQVLGYAPAELILVDNCENNMFYIDMELNRRDTSVKRQCVMADIRDRAKIEQIFSELRPQIIFHTAAFKHVPMCEMNPVEAVKNNIIATRMLARLAEDYEVERFVLISTDKAVDPSSIMGATKKVAELIMQSMLGGSRTRFAFVRFGNVLGSNGSVVPVFKKQIARGGPVNVTHPDISRFFMSCREASQLVIQAAASGTGGEYFILNMGADIKIVDLARNLITLSGLTPDQDIKIAFTGLRPGEKMREQILTEEEKPVAELKNNIYVVKQKLIDKTIFNQQIDFLEKLVHEYDADCVVNMLKNMIMPHQPDYAPDSELLETFSAVSNAAPQELLEMPLSPYN